MTRLTCWAIPVSFLVSLFSFSFFFFFFAQATMHSIRDELDASAVARLDEHATIRRRSLMPGSAAALSAAAAAGVASPLPSTVGSPNGPRRAQSVFVGARGQGVCCAL